MNTNILTIIDYGSGNLRSAAKAFEHVSEEHNLGITVKVSSNPEDLRQADRIVLPGQGAFGDCMNSLCAIPGMVETLQDKVIKQATPFLGICVGMQLMASEGLEHGTHKGLGWIPGQVVPIDPADKSLKIPHMGWNEVRAHVTPAANSVSGLDFVQRVVSSSEHYYFVHSFMMQCKEDQHLLAVTDYGGPVAAIIGRDNMVGAQFHPEKSQESGLALIEGFLRWCP